jgi:hypothetical protein
MTVVMQWRDEEVTDDGGDATPHREVLQNSGTVCIQLCAMKSCINLLDFGGAEDSLAIYDPNLMPMTPMT